MKYSERINLQQCSGRGVCPEDRLKSKGETNKWVCPLGTYELSVYFAVWIGHSALAFVVAYRASSSGVNTSKWMEHWMEPSNYIAGYSMDNSDLEWKLFRKSVFETTLTYVLHSVVFHITVRSLDRTKCSLLLIPFWLLLHLYWTSAACILVISIHVILTTTITFYTKTQVWAWISCLVFVVKTGSWAPFSSSSPNNYYREFNMYLYTSIQILNFCIYLAKQRKQGLAKINSRLLLDYLEYLLYPLYSTALIVLFEDFHAQYENLRSRVASKTEKVVPSLRSILSKALRLLFWFYFLEFALHFFHVNAFFNSPFTMLNGLHNYEKASIAYIAGQFFHVKYVLIFGVPRLFAFIDGMSPPGAPICISRVSKYSLMWRHFDQGLYQFLKNQVYIPLLGHSSSPQISTLALSIRRLLAMVCVFLFVLSWHGPSSINYLAWVSLSALELCVERVAKDLIAPSTGWNWLKTRIGPANIMRLTAVSMLATVMPGIFGVFFFLSEAGVGHHIFEEVLVKGILSLLSPFEMRVGDPGFVMLHLLLLGYCFNCVCIYLEHRCRENGAERGLKDLKKNE